MNIQATKDLNNKARVISLYDICKLLGKRHNDSVKLAKEIHEKDGFGDYEKIVIEQNQGGKPIETYLYTKKQALMIGARLDSKNIIILVNELERLTNKLNKPKTILEVLENSIKEIKRLGKENLTLKEVIEAQKPKVNFANAIQGSSSNIDVETFAKALFDTEGIKMGRNKLFKWFKNNKYLQSNNKPYQHYIDRGLFKLKEGSYINQSTGETIIYTQTRITGKGQLYFTNKLLDEERNNSIEKYN